MTPRSRAARLAGVLLAALTVTPFTAAPTSAGDDAGVSPETLRPAALPTGPGTPLLRLVRRTIYDGVRRIELTGASYFTLLGRSGEDYLVLTSDRDYDSWTVERVARSGEQTRIAGGPGSQPTADVSDSGRHVVLAVDREGSTVFRVLDAVTGDLVVRRRFPGYPSVLDFGPRRMVLGRDAHRTTPARTFWWDPVADRTSLITRSVGGVADISADRLGTYTGDPQFGGCQTVTTLFRPRTVLWRSCEDRVDAFSPSGTRMATIPILSDGIGPLQVRVRGARGRLLDDYRADWFGPVHWESDRRLLLHVTGSRTAAMARCTLQRCERISRLYRFGDGDPLDTVPFWQFADESLLDR